MNFFKWSFILFWVVSITAVVGTMHSWHYADLQVAEDSKKQISKFQTEVKNFGVLHFLAPSCSCSQTIIDHLLKRGPLSESTANETVVIIDDVEKKYTSKFKEKKFNVISLKSSEIKKDYEGSIRGVPLVAIYDSKKVSRYVGGYSDKQITPFSNINITKFITDLKQGREISSMPVIGCAVSKEFQKLLDPFGLKYSRTN